LICVRPAGLSDADAIGRIHVAAWQQTYRGLIPDAVIDGFTPARRALRAFAQHTEGGEKRKKKRRAAR
jgi:hypothetical protein